MELNIKSYEKVLLIYISGSISVEDILVLDDELPKIYGQYQVVVISLEQAQVPEHLLGMLLKIREKHKIPKNRVLFTSINLPGVDAQDFSQALTTLNTQDTLRIVEIFKENQELKTLENEILHCETEYMSLLRQIARVKDEKKKFEDLEIEEIEENFQERLRRLHYIFRVLITEIRSLQKQVKVEFTSDKDPKEISKEIIELKREAVKVMRKRKVF